MGRDRLWPRIRSRHVQHRRGRRFQFRRDGEQGRSEEHTSELQSLMRSSYAVFCLKKQTRKSVADRCSRRAFADGFPVLRTEHKEMEKTAHLSDRYGYKHKP